MGFDTVPGSPTCPSSLPLRSSHVNCDNDVPVPVEYTRLPSAPTENAAIMIEGAYSTESATTCGSPETAPLETSNREETRRSFESR